MEKKAHTIGVCEENGLENDTGGDASWNGEADKERTKNGHPEIREPRVQILVVHVVEGSKGTTQNGVRSIEERIIGLVIVGELEIGCKVVESRR